MKKKKYDTAVVMLYVMGKERLLPHSFRKQIPFSTISTWRKADYANYIGHEYRFLFEEKWDVIALQEQVTKLRRQLLAVTRAWLPFQSEVQVLLQKAKQDRLLQKKLVATTSLLALSFSTSTALRLLGLHGAQYRKWKVSANLRCKGSETALCLRRYPNQLSSDEVRKLKALLNSTKFQHWPIASLAAYAFRKGFLMTSLFTWYKYARMLQLSHEPTSTPKPQVGLVATAPNEYWHSDTTYYPISEATKVCFTFVMDNYSKMILGFAVRETLCFELIKQALLGSLKTATKQKGANWSYLVTDGGRENQNRQVHQFLASLTQHKLTMITALKDIQFSNSPIEAIHGILKGRYLRNQKFSSPEELTKFLHLAVKDYNTKRPHCSLNLRTPKEAYFGIPLPFDPKQRMSVAKNDRIQKSKVTTCTACDAANAHKCKQPCWPTSSGQKS
ncbi:DDE-type integrase/transposase/recombinase [Flavisolibacter sp. BT320]|nr:DDE-type integrase/transposase/recombinase [Flavisolibacter longurius]